MTNGIGKTKDAVLRRVVTAAILIPLFVWLVLMASPRVFLYVTAVLVLWAGVEWVTLMGVRWFPAVIIYPLFLLSIMVVGFSFIPSAWIIPAAFVWWLVAAIAVLRYPAGTRLWGKSVVIKAMMGIFCLIPCWMAINYIRIDFINGQVTLLFLFLLIWAADSGAWFAGKKWGHRKVLPDVSPGKTLEGLLGGFVASAVVVLFALCWSRTPAIIWPGAILISFVTVASCVVGDLFESMLKREAGIKDSGCLLPGHGGLLDRIDSLLAAAPVFVSGAMLLDKILH